jgi:hypothetical protein
MLETKQWLLQQVIAGENVSQMISRAVNFKVGRGGNRKCAVNKTQKMCHE